MTIASGQDILASDMNQITPLGSPIASFLRVAPSGFAICEPATAYSRSTKVTFFDTVAPHQTFTVTIASPAVFTKVAHGLLAGDRITFKTTGALPTGLATNTYYYVLSTSLTADTFKLALSPEGTIINTSGSQSGVHTLYFMNILGKGDGSSTFTMPDLRGKTLVGMNAGINDLAFEPAAVNAGTDTVTIPDYTTPYQGQPVTLTTTGTLPAGLSLATTYYIVRTSATAIQFATSQANANANTAVIQDITDAGTGVHTINYSTTNLAVLGQSIGENTHGNSVAEEALHTHDLPNAGGGASSGVTNAGTGTGVAGVTSLARGGNARHNNMQPAAVVNWIMRIDAFA